MKWLTGLCPALHRFTCGFAFHGRIFFPQTEHFIFLSRWLRGETYVHVPYGIPRNHF